MRSEAWQILSPQLGGIVPGGGGSGLSLKRIMKFTSAPSARR